MTLKDEYKYLRTVHDLESRKTILTTGNISYRNWWKKAPEEDWFSRFIRHHFPEPEKAIRFYSVFGKRNVLDEKFEGAKVFYTAENVDPFTDHDGITMVPADRKIIERRIRLYGDQGGDGMDLALGFGCHEAKNYLRFPFWIRIFIDPESEYDDIARKVEEINHRKPDPARKGAVLIASHDLYGMRQYLTADVEQVMPITYAGKWRNNSDRLWNEYKNNKQAFLRQYRFTVCPENMDARGYTTEKLFDAVEARCVPLYAGSNGAPEPEILNRDAYILWNLDGENGDAIRRVRELNENDRAYEEFITRPVFTPEAAEVIWGMLCELKERLGQLL